MPFDDERNLKRRTVVVENGFLRNLLTGRQEAGKLNLTVSGNSRAQDFTHFPIVRQTNFFMTQGDHDLEEIIREAREGIYISGRGSMGGEADPGSGTFTFSAGPSRMIRNGELAELVRGVVISGTILKTLRGVEAVGKNLRISTSPFGGAARATSLRGSETEDHM